MKDITELLEIMARLRDRERGCPWDVEQTFATIAPYTVEEAYEVADAIERDDMGALRDELGDLLLQVVFHAQMAREAGHFAFGDVVESICDKLVRRHPHVFGEARIDGAAAQTRAWEDVKQREREASGDASALAGIARGLPEWLRAVKLQQRAARVGFDWPDADPVFDKLHEELDEVRAELAAPERDMARLEDEIGDVLFVCANLARHAKVDPGAALRRANAKFERRFRRMEALAAGRGTTLAGLTLQQQDALWDEAKAEERS
jgi:nucleoside triphosphate diphosphatase